MASLMESGTRLIRLDPNKYDLSGHKATGALLHPNIIFL